MSCFPPTVLFPLHSPGLGQGVGTGKTYSSLLISLLPIPHQQCFPLCPENCQCGAALCVGEELLWVARPGPWAGERDNRRSRLPRAASHTCLQYQAGLQGHTLTPCKKQSSRIWVQQGGKVLIPCLRGWKISSLLARWCFLCADIWHTDLANRLSKANTTHIASWLLEAAISCPWLALTGMLSVYSWQKAQPQKQKIKERGHCQWKSDLSETDGTVDVGQLCS